MKYRIELSQHGKDTRVFEIDDDGQETETTQQWDDLHVPLLNRPRLLMGSPFGPDRVLLIESGTIEVTGVEELPGEV